MEDELETGGATIQQSESQKSDPVNPINPAAPEPQVKMSDFWDSSFELTSASVQDYQNTYNSNSYESMQDSREGLGDVGPNTDRLELLAQNQSWLSKVGSGTGRLVVETAINILEIPGTVGGAIGWAFTGDIENMTNNWWVNLADDAKQKLHETLPVYQTNAVKEGNVLDKMLSASWWASEGASGASFMASAFAPGIGVLQAGKVFSLTRGLAKGGKFAERALRGSDQIAGFMKGGIRGAKAAKASNVAGEATRNSINFINNTAMNTIWESGVEARGSHQAMLEDIEYKYNTGEITAVEKAELLEQAASNAASTFGFNVGVLMGPNAIMSKIMLGPRGAKTKLFKGVAYDKAAGKFAPKAAEEAVEKGVKSWKAVKGMGYAGKKAASFGKVAGREGLVEELGQMAVEQTFGAETLGEAPRTYAEIGQDLAKNYLQALESGDGQAAVVLSGILGSGATYIMDKANGKKSPEDTEKMLATLGSTHINEGIKNYKNNYFHGLRKGFINRDKDGVPIDKDGKITYDLKEAIDSEAINEAVDAELWVKNNQDAARDLVLAGKPHLARALYRQLQVSAQLPFIDAGNEGAKLLEEYLRNDPAVDSLLEQDSEYKYMDPVQAKEEFISEELNKFKDLQKEVKDYEKTVQRSLNNKHLKKLHKEGVEVSAEEFGIIKEGFDLWSREKYAIAVASRDELEDNKKVTERLIKDFSEDGTKKSGVADSFQEDLDELNEIIDQTQKEIDKFSDFSAQEKQWQDYVDERVKKEKYASKEVEDAAGEAIEKVETATTEEQVETAKEELAQEGFNTEGVSEEKAAEEVIKEEENPQPKNEGEPSADYLTKAERTYKEMFLDDWNRYEKMSEEKRGEVANDLEKVMLPHDPSFKDLIKLTLLTRGNEELMKGWTPTIKEQVKLYSEKLLPIFLNETKETSKVTENKDVKEEESAAITRDITEELSRVPKAYHSVFTVLASKDKKAIREVIKKLAKSLDDSKVTQATLNKKATELGILLSQYPEFAEKVSDKAKKQAKGKKDKIKDLISKLNGETAEPKKKVSAKVPTAEISEAVKAINESPIVDVLLDIISTKEEAIQQAKIDAWNARAAAEQMQVKEAQAYGNKLKEGDTVFHIQKDTSTEPVTILSLFNSKESGENALIRTDTGLKVVSTAKLTRNEVSHYDLNEESWKKTDFEPDIENTRVSFNDKPGSSFDEYSKEPRNKLEDVLEFQFAISNIDAQLKGDKIDDKLRKRLINVKAAFDLMQEGKSAKFLLKKGNEQVLEDFMLYMPITIRTTTKEGGLSSGRHIATVSDQALWNTLERGLREEILNAWITNDKGLKGNKGQKPNVMVGVQGKWGAQRRGVLNAKRGRKSNILNLKGVTIDNVELFTPIGTKGKVLDEQGQQVEIPARIKGHQGKVFMKIQDNLGEDFYVILDGRTFEGTKELDLLVQLIEDLVEGKVTKKDKLGVEAASYLHKIPGLFDNTANTVNYEQVLASLVTAGRPGDPTFLMVDVGSVTIGSNRYNASEFKQYKSSIKKILGNKNQHIPFKARKGFTGLNNKSFKQYVLESDVLTSNLEEEAPFFTGNTSFKLGPQDIIKGEGLPKKTAPNVNTLTLSTKQRGIEKGLTNSAARYVAQSKTIDVDSLTPEAVKYINGLTRRDIVRPSSTVLKKIKGFLNEEIDENCK